MNLTSGDLSEVLIPLPSTKGTVHAAIRSAAVPGTRWLSRLIERDVIELTRAEAADPGR